MELVTANKIKDDIQGLFTHKHYLETRLEDVTLALLRHDEQRRLILKDKVKVEDLLKNITIMILDKTALLV